MSVHPIFGHLFHHMGEAGLLPQQPAPAVDLDDRMACAIAEIDMALAVVNRGPLDQGHHAVLRNPRRFRGFVRELSTQYRVDLSSPLALLTQWHAWHNGA